MGDPIGSLSNRLNTGGYNVDPAARRAALSEALMRTGAGLSQGAMKPAEEGGGFAALAPALLGGMSGMRERFAEADAMERQRREEADRHRLFEEQLAGARQGRELAAKGDERAGQQFQWAATDRTRAEGDREAAGHGVESMVAAIESDAGADSPEARQARAFASLGSKADVERLAALHDSVLTRQRRPADEAAAAERKLAADKARIAAGVESDPVAQQRLAERQAAAYERQVSEQGRRTSAVFGQLPDDIRATEQDIYTRLEKEAKGRIGDMPLPVMEPDGKGGQRVKVGPDGQPVFPQVPYGDLRRQARVEALKTEYGRRGVSLAPVEQLLGFPLQNDRFIEIALQGLAANQDPRLIAQQIREAREAYFRTQGRR